MAHHQISQAAWEAQLRRTQSRDPRMPGYAISMRPAAEQLSDADMLASGEPLERLFLRAAVQPARRADCVRIMRLQLSPGALSPGGQFDETDPVGRAALLAEINRRCGT